MKISIIGTGYVGLVSGACLAEKGHHVVCVDIDQSKVDRINRGIPTIHEQGLAELLSKHAGSRLEATTNLEEAVLDTELSLIAVGTPYHGDEIDLSQIRGAARAIGEAIRIKDTYHCVIVKSTVVPGTTDEVVVTQLQATSGKRAGEDFGVGMNPEFLREGVAVEDFMNPDRIVMGAIDARSLQCLDRLYAAFPNVDKLRTTTRTAEMIKYAANSLLATLISFSNEIGNLCSAEKVDVLEVMRGVHLDKRLSPILANGSRLTPALTTYLAAGCGFGGSCFPKDVKALIAHGRRVGMPMELLSSVMRINDRQPGEVLRLLNKHFPILENICIAVLGLAFKPGTDDMRESPAVPVVEALRAAGATVRVYDPAAGLEARNVFGDGNIVYCDSLKQAVLNVEAVVIMTSWEEFEGVPDIILARDPQPLVVDGRRMLDKHLFARYEGIGAP